MAATKVDNRGLILQLVPDDEVASVVEAWSTVLKRWRNVAPAPSMMDVRNPGMESALDGFIHDALLSLAKAGVRNSLKKLSWVSYCMFDPEYDKDWTEAKNKIEAAAGVRVRDSDTLLSEYRDIAEHKDEATWPVQFQSADGSVVVRDRVFPFWGREQRLGLDSKQKALKFYKDSLKSRGIM